MKRRLTFGKIGGTNDFYTTSLRCPSFSAISNGFHTDLRIFFLFDVKVAGGHVDMATGGDQGGSIRIPAAACGIVGLKPTYGLVPYTGIMPIEFTLDHTGPMARTVYDTALMLEVRSITQKKDCLFTQRDILLSKSLIA